MRSFTITEEPVQPVMFRRLYQDVKEVVDKGDNSIAYIEKGFYKLVRDKPYIIRGIADLLTIQQIPYRTFVFEDLHDDPFKGLVI